MIAFRPGRAADPEALEHIEVEAMTLFPDPTTDSRWLGAAMLEMVCSQPPANTSVLRGFADLPCGERVFTNGGQ